MKESQDTNWRISTEQYFQKEFDGLRMYLDSNYSYDSSRLQLHYTVLEESKRWNRTASKYKFSLADGEQCLISLELEDLLEQEKDQAFIDFLGTIDGEYIPIGSVLLLKRLELASGIEDLEIRALVHAMAVLAHNHSELVVCPKQEMTRQLSVVQDTWHDIYGFRSEKEVEYEGKRYYRYDAATSWHH